MTDKLKLLQEKFNVLLNDKYVEYFDLKSQIPIDAITTYKQNGNSISNYIFVSDYEPRWFSDDFIKLQGFGTKSVHYISEFNKFFEIAELEAKKYNEGKVTIENDHNSNMVIMIRWRETNDEIYNRLEQKYNRIIEQIERRKNTVIDDYEKFKKLIENDKK